MNVSVDVMSESKKPCPMCGNKDWTMMSIQMVPGKGTMEVCEQCDPFMWIDPIPDYVCPYNDIYCMFEIRDGHRSMCSCWGRGMDRVVKTEEHGIHGDYYNHDNKQCITQTSFCWPNKTLIEYLLKENPNRIIGILTSEKLKRRYFVTPPRIDNMYEVKVIRK